MFKLSLSLSILPESLNKSLRSHWRHQRQAGKGWDCLIWAETSGLRPPQPLHRARISLVRHSHRMLDFDGLTGSLKPVVDAFVTAGVIVDDRWSVLGAWHVDQKFRPKAEGPLLEITVEEVCPD